MIVLMIGAPGAGKGTQADLMVSRLKYRKISTGDALRKHVKMGSPIGKVAESIMAKGELVSDDVLLKILGEELGSDSKEVVILDGYPRNVSQAQALSELNSPHKVRVCVHLDVPKQDLIDRLSGRRVCSNCGASFHVTNAPSQKGDLCDRCGGQLVQRPDDQPASIQTRLEVYAKNTEPVLEFYRKADLYCKVDGRGELEEIFGEVSEVLKAAGLQ